MAETALAIAETAPDFDLSLEEILDADNIVDLLEDAQLNMIGSNCIRDFEIDETSRRDWLIRYKRSLDIAMQVRQEKTFPWPKAANIHYPLLTTAAVQFQARAYPAIVDGSNLVKGRVLGPDDQNGTKRARADRIGSHMTWQLLYQMPGWEEDTDRLLLMLPIVGCCFRKSYYDEIRRTNMSVSVSAEHFVVNYWAKSLDSTPRSTHIMPMYPHEVRERVKAKLWRDVPLEQEEQAEDDQGLVDILEQHCLIDLDGDGYPEPYIVTMTRRGGIARIMPCFGPEDVLVSEDGKTVVRIERRQYFTKYGFIPAPDGSFYDMGFGTLLEDLSGAIDATINQMLDAGTLQNMQGGFIGSGINTRRGVKAFKPGEWKAMDVTGGTLRDNIVPLNLPGPSAVLFSLLGMLIESAKGITSVQDIMTGAEQSANTPATTTLARIEQGMKVMTGIFKRIHRAFRGELKILFNLNRDFLDEEQYFNLNDEPAMIGRQDYQDKDLDVVPVSDPTMSTDAQKLARAEVLMSQQANPLLDPAEITRRFLEAAGIPDIGKLFKKEPPGPPPEVLVQIEAQADNHAKAMAEIRSKDAASAASLATAAKTMMEMGAISDAEALGSAAMTAAREFVEGTEPGEEPADGQGRVQPMEDVGGDGGIPGLSGPAPTELDGGMGGGEAVAGGGPDGGIPMQPADGLVPG
jgi:chaperonin GroES